MIKSCIFIRWQHWKTYMGKADTDVGFSSLCLLSSLKAACRVWLWSRYLKAAAEKHTHTHELQLQPVSQSLTDVKLTRSQAHNVNTKGFPVSSGGHSFFCTFSFCPPTHPLSSGRHRASLGFDIRHHPCQTHPNHQQWESYSRKEQTLVQRMTKTNDLRLIWETVLITDKDR